ncbi:MAG: HlyD family efflux transporter periplasmic adaptor subunit [Blastocatellia bacterium]|nr:HlyD family efflux transporter periplasmic adaptor subunit [Blastocatellia bacterium]
MDKPRDKAVARNRKIRQGIYLLLLVGGISAVSVLLARLKPAAPTIERSTVITDAVKQGQMIRSVRGMGTLVPEEIVWIPAMTSGRVEKRLVQPGTIVTPDTVIFELSNQELQQQLMDAEAVLKSAEAEYVNRKTDLETQLLNQKAQAATVEADFMNAKLEAEANEALSKDGLVSEIRLKQLKMKASELGTRNELEKKRLAMTSEAMKTQLAVSQATLDQRRTLYNLRQKQIADLRIRAGMNGVLQELTVQIGQQVAPGTNLARVSDPNRLKAEVKIAETQAKDIQIGQTAQIDTRNGVINGRVRRVDPAVQNGTRLIEVQLLGELPKGAVPDLNVDGVIELERLENVLYVQRPTFGQEGSTIKLFKLEPDETHAEAVTVTLGRASVTVIEVRGGLRVGDKVIVSDTSRVGDDATRIRLN